jgi:hypothetical protein
VWVVHDNDTFEYTPCMVFTIGVVLYDGPEGMILTSSVIEDGTVGRRFQIPRGMIREVEEIVERKEDAVKKGK